MKEKLTNKTLIKKKFWRAIVLMQYINQTILLTRSQEKAKPAKPENPDKMSYLDIEKPKSCWYKIEILTYPTEKQWHVVKYPSNDSAYKGKDHLVNEPLVLLGLFGNLNGLFGQDLLCLNRLFRQDLLGLSYCLRNQTFPDRKNQ